MNARHRHLFLLWGAWVVSRLFIVAQVGVWNSVDGPGYADVNYYQHVSNLLADTGAMPDEDSWQYPPLAAFLFLVPRWGPDYFQSFMVLMLIFDALGVWLLSRRGSDLLPIGAWYWVLLLTTLVALPVLRFDLLTAVTAIAALVLAPRHPVLSGLALGAGFMLKLWPVVALLGEWNRRRLAIMIGGMAAVAVASFGLGAVFFGDQSGFLSNQAGRGLQQEAVGATPWHLRSMVTGQKVGLAQRNGTNEIDSVIADHVASGLQVATLLAVLLVAVWALARDRLIRRHGRVDLQEVAVGRDAAFAATLLAMVTNGVLSPQFLMWLVGVGAVCVGTRGSRLLRPTLMVAAAVVLTMGLYQSPATLVLRNVLLVVACADSVWLCATMLRRPRSTAGGQDVVEARRPALHS